MLLAVLAALDRCKCRSHRVGRVEQKAPLVFIRQISQAEVDPWSTPIIPQHEYSMRSVP